MRVKFNKRIKLGNGITANISKSGVGFSVKKDNVTITKTAKNKVRTTINIPGTGISLIDEK